MEASKHGTRESARVARADWVSECWVPACAESCLDAASFTLQTRKATRCLPLLFVSSIAVNRLVHTRVPINRLVHTRVPTAFKCTTTIYACLRHSSLVQAKTMAFPTLYIILSPSLDYRSMQRARGACLQRSQRVRLQENLMSMFGAVLV